MATGAFGGMFPCIAFDEAEIVKEKPAVIGVDWY